MTNVVKEPKYGEQNVFFLQCGMCLENWQI